MRGITGLILGGTALGLATVPAASLVAQPIIVLSNVYSHSQQIANGVANDTITGINGNITQSSINSDINNLPAGNSSDQSQIQTIDSEYSSINQINQ